MHMLFFDLRFESIIEVGFLEVYANRLQPDGDHMSFLMGEVDVKNCRLRMYGERNR